MPPTTSPTAPRCSTSWAAAHGYEADRGFRWTDGAGVLPRRTLAAFAAGELTIEVHIGCTAQYPAEDGKQALAA